MTIKKSTLIKCSVENEVGLRRLAKWLELPYEGDIQDVLKLLFMTKLFPSDQGWGMFPTGFRGVVI